MRLTSIAALILCSTLAMAVEPAAKDWPNWRGPTHDGVSTEKDWSHAWGADGPKVLWRTAVGKGFASLVVGEGRVIAMGNDQDTDTVFCFDAASGKQAWKFSYRCELQALAYEGGPGATPAIAKGKVFTFSKGGDLKCLLLATGAVVWERSIKLWPFQEGDWKNNWRYSGSPLIADGRLVMALGQAGAVLDPATGASRWESPAGHPGYSSPVACTLGGKPGYVFFSGHAVNGVDAAGKRLWSIPWKTQWDFNAADPVVVGGQMLVTSGNGVGSALFDLSDKEPREVWRNKELKSQHAAPLVIDGAIYGFDDGRLVCMEWATGKVHWSDGRLGKGTAILAGDRLLLLGEKGLLIAAEPSTASFKVLAQAKVLDGRCWSVPALAGGRLYVRNAAGDVVCLDL